MATGTMEERLVTLETRLDSLQRQVEDNLIPAPSKAERGWKAIVGTRLSSPDLKIAAIALTRNATLITQNTRDFQDIAGLKLKDWTR